MVIEKSDDWSANLMAKLLQHLSLTNIVTPNQMTQVSSGKRDVCVYIFDHSNF